MIGSRIVKLLKNVMEENNADAYLILNPYNIKYVAGISLYGDPPLSAVIYSKDEELVGITSSLEENRAKDLFDGELFVFTRSKDLPWEHAESKELAIKKVLEKINAKRVISDTELSLEGTDLKKDETIYNARMIKTKRELKLIEKAVWIAERALYDVRDLIMEGVSEIEIAREIILSILSNGGQWLSFDVIVASGPNAAYPHHEPTQRVLRKGEPVIIDLGAYYEGYASDITRTFFVEDYIPPEWEKYYNCVVEMQENAIKSVKPDVKTVYVDRITRETLREYFGEAYMYLYNHSTGHGVGLEVHEKPYLGPPTKNKDSSLQLKEGMVFTIEPGVYVHGKGGIRIEDMVVVTSSGVRVLSSFPK
ncbi:MAG: aminopeptidase P family protein [Euryarchaeota archaeon]|nr:aminopeptidase P family protein [Euryarchaeota archaeon]